MNNELTLAQRGQIKRIMDRIKISRMGMAVFKDADGLHAVFDRTVHTNYIIKENLLELVGRYNKSSEGVEEELISALGGRVL